MTQHRHQEALRNMADGAKFPDDFDYIHNNNDTWGPAEDWHIAALLHGYGTFRRKPVPKPDIVQTIEVVLHCDELIRWNNSNSPNVEFTFTADGVLKDARVLK